jgi:hypothetical protein
MFNHRYEDFVAGSQANGVIPALCERIAYEVDGLGAVSRENDLTPAPGADETGDVLMRLPIQVGRLVAGSVCGAVHRRVVPRVERPDGIRDLNWFMGCRGIVEVYQLPSFGLPLEEGEVMSVRREVHVVSVET